MTDLKNLLIQHKVEPRHYESCAHLFNGTGDPVWPPPKTIPPHLYLRYTLNNSIPVRERYFNEAKEQNAGDVQPKTWTKDDFQSYLNQLATYNGNNLNYGSYKPHSNYIWHVLNKLGVQGKDLLVLGTEKVWIEAMLLHLGAKTITTIEYHPIKVDWPEYQDRIFAYTPQQAFEMLQNSTWKPKDIAISFSSYEHDGLGRYGDPINPEADLITMDRATCFVKKNGLMLLGVPTGSDTLVWNAHRIYGIIRYPLLISGWDIQDIYGELPKMHYFTADPFIHAKLHIKQVSCQPIVTLKNKGCACQLDDHSIHDDL